jgi:hypothetical protein
MAKQRKQKQRKMMVRSAMIVNHPPQIQSTLKGSTTLRFSAQNGGAYLISARDMLDTLLVGVSTTAAYDIFETIRIKHVELWGINVLTNVPVTVSLQYYDNSNVETATKVFSDTSIGTTEAAHVKASPPSLSSAKFWQGNNSGNLFYIVVPQYAVIDVAFEYVLASGSYSQVAQNAIVGGSPGIIFARGLDGLASASTALPPVIGTYDLA